MVEFFEIWVWFPALCSLNTLVGSTNLKSTYFIYLIHLSSRHFIDHLLNTRLCSCHYLCNLSLGSWHSGSSTINLLHVLSLPSPGSPFLTSKATEGGKSTLGTRLPALNIQKKLYSQRKCRILDFCLPPSYFLKSVFYVCNRTVVSMSLKWQGSLLSHLLRLTPEVIVVLANKYIPTFSRKTITWTSPFEKRLRLLEMCVWNLRLSLNWNS